MESFFHMYKGYHILYNLYKKLINNADIRYYANTIHAKNEVKFFKYSSSKTITFIVLPALIPRPFWFYLIIC
jgi:hypothetical protein